MNNEALARNCTVTCELYLRDSNLGLSLCKMIVNPNLSYPYDHDTAYLGSQCRYGLTEKQTKKILYSLAQSSPKCTGPTIRSDAIADAALESLTELRGKDPGQFKHDDQPLVRKDGDPYHFSRNFQFS